MATNKIVLRTVQEFMADYQPIYKPVYPLFLSKSQQYPTEAGRIEFRRAITIGDIRAKTVTPKDTEIKQIAVNEGKKYFKKYFQATQFQMSHLQDRLGVEDVVKQVLDEHQIQADELVMFGEGSDAASAINNGLYWSQDPNYTLENSGAITDLTDLHASVINAASIANQVAGRKVLMVYGEDVLPLFNGVYENAAVAFKKVLSDVLGADYSLIQMPKAPTPAGANGFIIANLEQTKLHYTALPQLLDQGSNDEKMYLWFNFMMGSTMLEVLAKDGIVRQPVTVS